MSALTDNFEFTKRREEMVRLHASKAFDLSMLSPTTRAALRRTGVPLSASGTVRGLTVSEVDKLLAASELTAQERMAVKFDLGQRGVMIYPPAA